MEFTEILGYALAVVTGFILGLLGGGGAILTFPVLVYLVGISEVTATSYSLFVVGVSSLVGATSYMRRKLLSYPIALWFAGPSLLAVLATRQFLMPWVPEEIFSVGGFVLTKGIAIKLFFAVVMLLAGYNMIKKKSTEETPAENINYGFIVLNGLAVGIVTGITGAGGGFLIVPVLVLIAKLPMRLTIGTSLLIITINSLLGFAGDLGTVQMDWGFLLAYTAIAVAGIFIGIRVSKSVDAKKLKTVFGYFVLFMAAAILAKEFF